MTEQSRMTSAFTRRSFVAGVAALPVALRHVAAEGIRNPKWVLLGTDKGQGIYRASWNPLTGELGKPELAIASDRPTYFARHPKRPILYSANEAAKGDGSVSSFHLNDKTAELQSLQVISSRGEAPCYISIDQTGRSLFAANYTGGNVAAFDLKGDGSLSPAGIFDCKENAACGALGPRSDRQAAAHMHCCVVSPDNKYIVTCNLGEDAFEVFPITPGSAAELLGTPTRFAARSGSGPRHVVFHPNGRWMYCIHELDCTIDVYGWSKGVPTPLGGSTVTTLGANPPTTGNTACEIVISDNGKFVYANTRGENSLAVYRVNDKTGFVTEQQRVQTGGTVTRLIALDPSHQWLLCMNQGSSSVTVFSHDAKTGKLSNNPKLFSADTPMCAEWV